MRRSLVLVSSLLVAGCGNPPRNPVFDLAGQDGPRDAGGKDGPAPDMAKPDGGGGADAAPPDDGGAVDATVDDMPPADDASMDDLTPGPDLVPEPDLGPTVSDQIQAVRDAIDQGAFPDGGMLSITGAYVTYTKVTVGTDVAGFFVQRDPTGPALFIAVDPTSLQPPAQKGDLVSFNVNAFGKNAGLRQVTGIDTWAQISAGNDVSFLVQDLSNEANLVANVDDFESELMTLKATITSTFAANGAGFVAAGIDTAAVMGNASLKLRVTIPTRDADDLALGCTVQVVATPLWRFNAQAEPHGWVPADIKPLTCPAPKVLGAAAMSPTQVVVTFDRLIDPASVHANGDQFTFNNGLVASAAVVVNGRTALLTTAAQTGGTQYTVTVAQSVTDTLGKGVDPNANTATFTGFRVAAVLRLNEVSPNITGSADLMEFRVMSAGDLANITIVMDVAAPTVLATLPPLAVAQDDLVVVHMTPPNGVTTETNAKNQCVAAGCYPNAWDINGNNTGITFSNRTLSVKAPDGSYQDAAAFYRPTSNNVAYPADVQALQTAAQWLPVDCGGAPCTYNSNPTVLQVTVDWTGVGTSAGGNSVARKMGVDTDQNTDWAVGASSLGAPNP